MDPHIATTYLQAFPCHSSESTEPDFFSQVPEAMLRFSYNHLEAGFPSVSNPSGYHFEMHESSQQTVHSEEQFPALSPPLRDREDFTRTQQHPRKRRGRPRLDDNTTNSEERRRTQIRLAQRKYRGNKESSYERSQATVTRLENKLRKLKNHWIVLKNIPAVRSILEEYPEETGQVDFLFTQSSEDHDSSARAEDDQTDTVHQGHYPECRNSKALCNVVGDI
ncbi:uncharacterized protein VDAG_05229 [Verticillium dahliae VdLs.17]|uniref:BZIP domain-containing protein n=1 Tax=Verticillium dahliae (strain VdLs.17 / ATCC MYA-4575 / FGSC 10137) TaxID=498257 RepID=G2X4Z7_VERDV|nr:uncharacterized protein VDAG_05229 [Verticillium dahliae VdLs.17]EGY23791.1 hypothetical protein VDAG_05229 [Verticillium dahliae VdLs.17]